MFRQVLFFVFFINVFYSYGQHKFHYICYIDDTQRDGVLYYDEKENRAVYIDKISTTRVIENKEQNDEEKGTTISLSFNGDEDSYYIKKGSEVVYSYNFLKQDYLIKDELPEIQWKFSLEKKIIQDLVCYKATTKFRGRDWVAWYCPEIPITYGPWKFYGLPGMVVEMRDDSNRFGFSLAQYVLNSQEVAPKVTFSKHKEVTMKKMAEYVDEGFERIMSSLNERDENVEVTSSTTEAGIEAVYEWDE